MKLLKQSILLTIFFLVFTGLIFPLFIWAVAQAAFPKQANGSLVRNAKGDIIGSELIAQRFAKPEYFHPRASAAGNGYDPTSSGGTNLGPTSDKLINGIHKKLADGKDDPGNFDGIKDLVAAYRKENNLPDNQLIPADAATRSASGLDPHISPENAYLQAPRVATARHTSVDAVKKLIDENTEGRFLGVYGEPAVNVFKLNLALDGAKS